MTELGEFALFMAIGSASLGIFFGPISAAVAKRIAGGAKSSATQAELDELRSRVQELDMQVARLNEIEERVDFTERMLVQQRESAALPDGGRAES